MSSFNKSAIRSGVKHRVRRRHFGHFKVTQPALTVWITVYQFGVALERRIDCNHLSGERGINLGDTLGALYFAE